jgi:uncharacterized protein (TIGR00255 family)
MAVSSMTGFARAAGSGGAWRWTFELKSVNAKGLDIRLRIPAPFDRVETEARARLGRAFARGTCFGALTAHRDGPAVTARIDLKALESIAVTAREAAAKIGVAPPTMDGLLALRDVFGVGDSADDEEAVDTACVGALLSLDEAIAALTATRRAEGEALAAVLARTPQGRRRNRRGRRPEPSARARGGAQPPRPEHPGADGVLPEF